MITKAWRSTACVMVFCLVLGGVRAAEMQTDKVASPLPELTVLACSSAPYLDGVLTDECWQTATVISNLSVFKKPGETVGHKAYLTRDGQWLYIALEILHPAPKHIKQTVFEADGPVQTDDSVEVFLDPGSSNAFYLHYGLNAANIKSDEVFYKDGDIYKRGQMPWRSATRLTDKGWNAEMAFTIEEMTRGQSGPDRNARRFPCDWAKGARFNVCVNTVKPVFDSYGVRTSEENIQATWAPLVNGFQEAERFGTLLGIQPDAEVQTVFMPGLVSVEAGTYEFKEGQAFYKMTARIKNGARSASVSGMVEVVVVDKPVAGVSGEARERQSLDVKQEQDVSVRVPLTTPGRRTAVVWLKDALRGGAFDSWLLDDQAMQAADPFAAWLDRSYYTNEKEALVVCRLRIPREQMRGQRILVKDQSGKTVGQSDSLAADTKVAVALDQFQAGKHALMIEWCGKDGKSLTVQKVELAKLTPNPGCEVKVDQVNGVLIKDGQPVFPFGLCVAELNSQDEVYFKRIAEAGYNMIVWWGRKPDVEPQEYKAYLDVARKYGLYVLDAPCIQPVRPFNNWLREYLGMKVFNQKTFSEQEEVAIAREDLEQMLPGLKKCWEIARQFPNLLGYFNVDEPNSNGSLSANLAVMERYYSELKKTDPYRSVMILYSCNVPPGASWTQWGEILGYDPYVYPGFGGFSYSAPNFVSQKTIELKRRADSVHKITWIVPLASCLDPGRTPRILTAAEQNSQTYLALIHGAKGLIYFVNTALYTQPGWDALSNLAQQMKVIGPAVVAPAVPQEIVYRPSKMDAEKKIFPEVQAALFRHPDGRHILLAANSANYPMHTTFTVAGLQAPGVWQRLMGQNSVEHLFTRQSYALNGNAFSEELEPYGVRAYVIQMQNAECRMQNKIRRQTTDDRRQSSVYSLQSTAAIHLAVSMAPLPEREAAAKTLPIGDMIKRKGATMNKKNHVANPSLELMSIPGVPDNIRPNMYLNWPLVGAPGALWGIETNNPYHGKYCLRLVHQYKGGEPPKGNESNWRITSGMSYLPNISKPTTYTFSVYARAQREGEELGLYIEGMTLQEPKEKWKLTRDWKRYSFTGEFTKGQNQSFYLYTYSKDAIIWIDTLQMEQGDAPSAFTTD